MANVSESAGDEVKMPLGQLPQFPSPPLHRCHSSNMFLVLIDCFVSYTLWRSTSMLQYTVMIRKLDMIGVITIGEPEKHAMETL